MNPGVVRTAVKTVVLLGTAEVEVDSAIALVANARPSAAEAALEAVVAASALPGAKCLMRCVPSVERKLRFPSSPADRDPCTAGTASRPTALHDVVAAVEVALAIAAVEATVVPAATN